LDDETKTPSPRLTALINGEAVTMIVDSGAPKNIIDEVTYNQFGVKPKLQRDTARAVAYQQTTTLSTLGVFEALIEVGALGSCRTSITVAAGNSGCLLGHPTALTLGLYQTELFNRRMTQINAVASKYAAMMQLYPEVFNESIGKLKGYTAHIHVDRSVRPMQFSYHRLPYHMIEAVDRELDKLLEQGIIVEVHNPTDWVSAMCVVPKPKKPGSVRITLDSKMMNKAVNNMRYVMPTTQEIAYDLNGAKVFSHLDLNKAFHQIDYC
jgi:hypothetical protein